VASPRRTRGKESRDNVVAELRACEGIATSHEIPPDAIARELKVSDKEVNKAILAKTYADYIK
jgi:hypothetical protein